MKNYDESLDGFINDNNEPSVKKPIEGNNKKYLIDNRDTIVEQIERVVIVGDGRQLLCENK